MKTVLFVRHAKSSWGDPELEDIKRPLNDRGKKDAPLMAKRLLEKKIKIDAFISSPAKRARRTAVAFAKEYGEKKRDVILVDELYNASESSFNDAITNAKNKYDSIAVFSHNPGITDFVNTLTDVHVDDMPTCSVFAIKVDIDKWKGFKESKKEFWFFDQPKPDEKNS